MTDQKKPGVAFWATVVVVLLAYPLSFEPACWVTGRCRYHGDWLGSAYAPVIWTLNHSPRWLYRAIDWYAHAGAPEHCGWVETSAGKVVGFRTN